MLHLFVRFIRREDLWLWRKPARRFDCAVRRFRALLCGQTEGQNQWGTKGQWGASWERGASPCRLHHCVEEPIPHPLVCVSCPSVLWCVRCDVGGLPFFVLFVFCGRRPKRQHRGNQDTPAEATRVSVVPLLLSLSPPSFRSPRFSAAAGAEGQQSRAEQSRGEQRRAEEQQQQEQQTTGRREEGSGRDTRATMAKSEGRRAEERDRRTGGMEGEQRSDTGRQEPSARRRCPLVQLAAHEEQQSAVGAL
jgi:hypothetical protein